jgi:hypothetical protein
MGNLINKLTSNLQTYAKEAIVFFALIYALHVLVFRKLVAILKMPPIITVLLSGLICFGIFVCAEMAWLYYSEKCLRKVDEKTKAVEEWSLYLKRMFKQTVMLFSPYLFYYMFLVAGTAVPALFMFPLGRIAAGTIGKIVLAFIMAGADMIYMCPA